MDTNSYKHLGVTFSSDAKWYIQVENILLSIYKHLNVLRKLKYKLSRNNLEKLYLVYMRAICEYACAVLENCGLGNYNKLDPLQVGAARIVTGLPIFASSILIYKELAGNHWQKEKKEENYKCFIIYKRIMQPCIFCDFHHQFLKPFHLGILKLKL